jgi:hypothetical protein
MTQDLIEKPDKPDIKKQIKGDNSNPVTYLSDNHGNVPYSSVLLVFIFNKNQTIFMPAGKNTRSLWDSHMLHARELLKVKDLRRNKTRQKEENNSR